MKKSQFDLSQIKAVATDLDGTALNANHRLDPLTAKALDKAADKGLKVMLATGRPFLDAVGLVKESVHDFPLVTCNGAMLNHAYPVSDVVHFLPAEVVEQMVYRQYPEKIILNIYTTNKWYVSEDDEEVARYFADAHFEYNLLDVDKVIGHRIVKIFIIDSSISMKPTDYSQYLNDLQDELVKEFGDQIECCFSQVNCLEINAANVTKANTIAEYLAEFNLTNKENLLCFGDGMNDFKMLESAKLAFVMGNADPKLKKATAHMKHVHEVGTNDNLTVARILNDLFDLGLTELEPYFDAE